MSNEWKESWVCHSQHQTAERKNTHTSKKKYLTVNIWFITLYLLLFDESQIVNKQIYANYIPQNIIHVLTRSFLVFQSIYTHLFGYLQTIWFCFLCAGAGFYSQIDYYITWRFYYLNHWPTKYYITINSHSIICIWLMSVRKMESKTCVALIVFQCNQNRYQIVRLYLHIERECYLELIFEKELRVSMWVCVRWMHSLNEIDIETT